MTLTFRRRGARRFVAFAWVAWCALLISATAAAASITEFSIPAAHSGPGPITSGPDGNLWFVEETGDAIGRITPSGVVTGFSIPTPASSPGAIAVGPDGNLWFSEYNGDNVGRITPAGAITEYPTGIAGVHPTGIAAGPDGNLWVTVSSASASGVLRVNTSGTVTGIFTAPHRGAFSIVAGPDGNMWFTEVGDNYIARITTGASPTITDYLIPGAYIGPQFITAGPDGNLWFTSQSGRIGKVTTAGAITVYAVPTPNGGGAPAAGPDGNVWFTERSANRVASVTPSGVVTEYPLPTAASGPIGIVTGPDHNVWFAEYDANKIGLLTLAPRAKIIKAKIIKAKIDQKGHSAKVTFKARGATGFQCALVKAPSKKGKPSPKPHFKSCKSPKTYKHLASGKYIFEVRALAGKVVGPAAIRKFKI